MPLCPDDQGIPRKVRTDHAFMHEHNQSAPTSTADQRFGQKRDRDPSSSPETSRLTAAACRPGQKKTNSAKNFEKGC
jgi:hypothetical protein